MTAVKGLFNSCATPATSWPTPASLSFCTNWLCARRKRSKFSLELSSRRFISLASRIWRKKTQMPSTRIPMSVTSTRNVCNWVACGSKYSSYKPINGKESTARTAKEPGTWAKRSRSPPTNGSEGTFRARTAISMNQQIAA